MSLWDSIKAQAVKAGDATKLAAQKTKLRTDMMMIDREITNRQKTFGIQMYDHVSPLSQTADFYAASDELTTIIRPPLINAQKEIQALAAKRVKLKESLAAAEAKRAGAFPAPAETVGGKIKNFGKAGVLHSGETKIKAELAIVDRQIKGYKQTFGLELYQSFTEAEDTRGYLPSDRQVRSIYDQTRQDIQSMNARKKLKEEELISLGAQPPQEQQPQESQLQQQQQQHGGSFVSSYSDGINSSSNNNGIAPAVQQSGYLDSPANGSNKNEQVEDLLL